MPYLCRLNQLQQTAAFCADCTRPGPTRRPRPRRLLTLHRPARRRLHRLTTCLLAASCRRCQRLRSFAPVHLGEQSLHCPIRQHFRTSICDTLHSKAPSTRRCVTLSCTASTASTRASSRRPRAYARRSKPSGRSEVARASSTMFSLLPVSRDRKRVVEAAELIRFVALRQTSLRRSSLVTRRSSPSTPTALSGTSLTSSSENAKRCAC